MSLSGEDLYPGEANLADQDVDEVAKAIVSAYPVPDFLYFQPATV